MPYSDPTFEQRRAQILRGGVGATSSSSSSVVNRPSTTGFSDPSFETRRKQVYSNPTPVRKIPAVQKPVAQATPTPPSFLQQTQQAGQSVATGVGGFAQEVQKKILGLFTPAGGKQIEIPSISKQQKEITPQLIEKVGKIKVGEKLPGYETQKTPSAQLKVKQKPPTSENIIDTLFNKPADFLLNETGIFGETIKKTAKDIYDNPTDYVSPIIKTTKQQSPQAKAAVESSPVYKAQNAALQGAIRGALEVVGNWNPRVEGFLKKENERVEGQGGVEQKAAAFGKVVGQLAPYAVGGAAGAGLKIGRAVIPALFTVLGQTTLPSSTPADARLRNAIVDSVAGTVLEFMKPLQTLGKTSVGQKVLEHSKYLSKTLGVMSTQVYLNARSLGASNEQALEIVKDSALLILGMHGVVTGIKAGQGLTKSKFTEGSAVFTPDQARGIVIGSNLENTPAGKAIIKASFEADSSGKNLQIDMTLAKKSKVAGMLNLDTPGGIRLTKIDFIDGTGKLTGEVPFKYAEEGGPLAKAPNTPEGIKTVPISSVKTGLSDMVESRAKTDTPKIKEYEEAYKRGDKIPPVPVFEENGIQTLNKDGFHRLQAQKNLGMEEIEVRVEPKTELSGGEKQASENRKVVEQKEKTTVLERSTAVKEEFEKATDNIEDFNERGDVIRSMVDERISRAQAGAISKEEIQDLKATRAALNKMLYGEDQSSDEMRRFVDEMKTMPETERFHSGVTDSIIKIDRILDAVKSQKGYTIEPNFIISKDKRVKPVLDKTNPYKVKIDDTEFFGNDRKKVTEQAENYIKERNKKVEEYISKKDTVKFRTAQDLNDVALTTKIIKDLGDRETVSKQYILDQTNRGDIKQQERELIRSLLESEPDKVNVADFKLKVQAELLPLTVNSTNLKITQDMRENPNFDEHFANIDTRYENITLPHDLRGPVENYYENVYESPIKTSAGEKHFYGDTENYFGHTRVEDLPNKTWRIIEVQSDLYQKGGLDDEIPAFLNASDYLPADKLREYNRIEKRLADLTFADNSADYKVEIEELKKAREAVELSAKDIQEKVISSRKIEVAKLRQYNDPTAHFRMIREEVKRAADNGIKTIQFPTGETAMKIEGLGNDVGDPWRSKSEEKHLTDSDGVKYGSYNTLLKEISSNLYVGMPIVKGRVEWVITDVLGEGKFKAVSKEIYEKYINSANLKTAHQKAQARSSLSSMEETFDVSGKADTNNPIYKFYEKEVSKYLKNKYGAELVTDKRGVDWYEVKVKPEMSDAVEAFRFKDDFERVTGRTMTDEQEAELIDLNKKVFGDTDIKIVGQILANKDALGSYKTGMIRIVEGQANPKDTFYHEAVHKYIDTFSTRQEQIDLLLQAQKEYGIEDFAQVEEKIAEDFINYAKDREGWAGKLKSFFDRILTRIKEYFGNIDRIDKLYQDILSNKKVPQPATRSSIEDNAPQTVKKSATDDSGAGAPPVVEKGPDAKVSRFQERVAEQLLDTDGGTKYELNPETGSYNKLNLEKDAKAAVDFLNTNPEQAMRVAMGFEKPPEGQTANAISIAAAFKAKDEGNVRLWKDLILKTSLRSTRFGQEIVSLRGKFNDDSPENFIKQVIDTRMNKLGKSLVSDAEAAIGKEKSVKTRAVDKIDREVERLQKRLKKDRSKIQMAQDIIDSLKCI